MSQTVDPPRPGLLAGLTVVSIEQAVSAPFCTRALADFGARVIKIENPRGGDFTRGYDDVVHGLAAHFTWLNRGKESVTVDLKDAAGRALLERLLAGADVLVSNLGPGATSRLGLDATALGEHHPHLVSLEISGYGTEGPLAGKRAYDLLVQAESGVCSITGWPGQPAKPGPPFADVCTGMYAALTILAALHERDREPRGAAATVSMFDTMIELMSYALNHARYGGVDQQPVGMASPAVAPYGAYRTADANTVVLGTTNDAEWQRLAVMIERPDLAADERFRRNPDRVTHRAELDRAVATWCLDRPLAQVQQAADAAGIGNARYNVPSEVLAHPQLSSRGRWQTVGSPVGPLLAALPPAVIAGYPPAMGDIPALGQHTDAVLAEFGFSGEEIARLHAGGTI